MSEHTLHLPWLNGTLDVKLPPDWHLAAVLEPSPLPGVEDVVDEIRRSLAKPIDSPRLEEIAGAGMRVAIVMDDGSRPTPVSLILPEVLDSLEKAGVARERITLVPALGLHRPMQEDEIAKRAGAAAVDGLQWENPDCDDPDRLVYLGTTKRGTPVWVNKAVAQADLIVSIGCIEPHIIASFGGGYKNLFPGVAGRETIAHNHGLNCTPDTFNMVGRPIHRNPMRLDLEEAGQMLKPTVFIVNVVLNSSLEIVRLVAGAPIAAHREGAEISAGMYGVKVPSTADIVITNSHPMNQDLRQGVKALANAIRAVRRGGVLVTLVRADEGVGVFGLANHRLPLGHGVLRLAAPLLLQIVPKIKLSGMGEEDRFFLYFALQALRHCTLLMYAPTIPAEVRASLPSVRFVDSPQEAIAKTRRRFPGQANVLAFPHGGTTYPILPT